MVYAFSVEKLHWANYGTYFDWKKDIIHDNNYLQSAMGNEVLSKGSAHFGSPSDRHTQHLIESPVDQMKNPSELCKSI